MLRMSSVSELQKLRLLRTTLKHEFVEAWTWPWPCLPDLKLRLAWLDDLIWFEQPLSHEQTTPHSIISFVPPFLTLLIPRFLLFFVAVAFYRKSWELSSFSLMRKKWSGSKQTNIHNRNSILGYSTKFQSGISHAKNINLWVFNSIDVQLKSEAS